MSQTVDEETTRKLIDVGPAYRYGFLAIALVYLGLQLWVFAREDRPRDPYGGIVVALMLLFNHLAFAFPWRRSLRIAFGAVAFCWLAFAGFYIFYWDDVLFAP